MLIAFPRVSHLQCLLYFIKIRFKLITLVILMFHIFIALQFVLCRSQPSVRCRQPHPVPLTLGGQVRLPLLRPVEWYGGRTLRSCPLKPSERPSATHIWRYYGLLSNMHVDAGSLTRQIYIARSIYYLYCYVHVNKTLEVSISCRCCQRKN